MALLYITISMITIFSMYIVHVCLGSGCNSYQGHVNDPGEFWRVLGCPHVRHHWKCDIVDTFTHIFCANGHGWTIGTSFSYIRKSERQHSSPVQYIVFSLVLVGSTLFYKLYYQLKHFTRWETSLLCCTLCCATGYGLLCHGRDVHPIWVMSLLIYDTKESGFCFWSTKCKEHLDSFWWQVVTSNANKGLIERILWMDLKARGWRGQGVLWMALYCRIITTSTNLFSFLITGR